MLKKFFKCITMSGFASICTMHISNAQEPANVFNNITIASPNAASLGKYADYPVNNHTGLPQINIPFYTVKDGSLSLPISISYHASGLKTQETASWVGAGWSLNAGGVITRTVIGANDDRGFGDVSIVTHGHFTNYGYNNYLYDGAGSSSVNDMEFTRGHRDGEPDLYFFNFGNYSGKFYFRDDRTPVLVPEEDFKIEPIVISPNFYIQGFIITTPDGVKFTFGKNQTGDGNIDAFEITSPNTGSQGLTHGSTISSWYLNKITSADNQFSISLIYQAERYSYYIHSTYPVADGDLYNKHITLVKNYIDGVRLSQINFSTGNIIFTPGLIRTDLSDEALTMADVVNTKATALGNIKISDYKTNCKYFNFYYNYFVDNTTSLPSDFSEGENITTDKKRLRLDSIVETSCNNSLRNPAYVFDYNGPSGFAPRRLTSGVDHWGYYNGKTTNIGLIPTYTVNETSPYNGANRDSKWPEMSYGSLNKIVYPTGGSTQFTFEGNTAWLTYTYYTNAIAASAGLGYDNYLEKTVPITTTANRYRFTLDYVTNPGGNSTGIASFNGLTVSKANPHAEITIVPGSGAHTYYLNQSGMSSVNSDRANANIYEVVPSTYQGNQVIGGLRIQNITNNDGSSSTVTSTNYNYNSGVQSNGILYSRPTYVRVLRNDILQKVGLFYTGDASCSPNGCVNCDMGTGWSKSPNSLRPMETSQGNHIGYNKVEVSKTGNGRSVYNYYGSNVWDQNQTDVCIRNVNVNVCPLTIPNYPDAPLPFEFLRGELKTESIYNETGSLQRLTNYYPVFQDNPVTTPAYLVSPGPNGEIGTLTLYNLTTAKKVKMTIVSNEYLSSGTTLITVDSLFFGSPYHCQLTRKVHINSLTEKIETKIKYAFDYRVPGCDAISDCFQAYYNSYTNALNTFNNEIATCTNNGTENCKWPAFQTYRYDWSVARKSYVSCRSTNFMNQTNAFKTAHDNAKAVAGIELKPILEMQDQFINNPIETTTWTNANLTQASFSRYDYVTNPTGKIYLNKTQNLPLTTPSSTFTVSNTSGSTVTKDSRYKDEDLVKFDKGNLVEVIKKDGIVTSYVYGYNNNYPVAKVVGVSYSQINTMSPLLSQIILQNPASDAALRTELDRLRTAFPTAMITTYTYIPLFGMSSETNANKRTTYYEYDTLGRLLRVKDANSKIIKQYDYKYLIPAQ